MVLELIELIGKVRGDDRDAVQADRQIGFLRGFEDRIVFAVTPERIHSRGGEVNTHDAVVFRALEDRSSKIGRAHV